MELIIISYKQHMDSIPSVVEKINGKLSKRGIKIVLRVSGQRHYDDDRDYDDERVYRTGERQLDSRLDRAVMMG
jgi:hypothetical protein